MSVEDQVETTDMSERILTAEYKDGQLQIVEVIPLDRSEHELDHLEPGTSSGQEQSYVQVMDADKNLLKLDLLNLALLKCQNGEEGYRLVTNSKASESDGENDTTITCVLQSSDGEEVDNESYVIMDGGQGPMVFLQSELEQTEGEALTQTVVAQAQQPSNQQPTPVEILERAKAIQKARANLIPSSRRGRRRKGSLPSPHELLSSPNFKLYLYSCRSCDFKCNAVKELTQHRATEHGAAGGKYRVRTACLQCAHCPYRANLYSQLENHIKEKHKGSTSINKVNGKILQCAKCPFQSNLHSQILKHVRDKHTSKQTDNLFSNELFLNSISAETADILVCGACGYESGDKESFKQHVIEEHGDNPC